MPPQAVTVDLVMRLLKDSQDKYNQELKSQYEARIKDIEHQLQACLPDGNHDLAVDKLAEEAMSKIKAAKCFDPPVLEVDWDEINSTLSGSSDGMIRWVDLSPGVQRQIKLLIFLDHPNVDRLSKPLGTLTNTSESNNMAGEGSENGKEWLDASENTRELVNKFANIKLPAHVDNSRDDSDSDAVENNETCAPINSKEDSSGSEARSSTPGSSESDSSGMQEQEQDQEHLALEKYTKSNEVCNQPDSDNADKENQSAPIERLTAIQNQYTGQVAAKVKPEVVCKGCGTRAVLDGPTHYRDHGLVLGVSSVTFATPIKENQSIEPRFACPGTAARYLINGEGRVMGERDSDDAQEYEGEEYHPITTARYLDQMKIIEERRAMKEIDMNDANLVPFKKEEYVPKTPRRGGGRIRATLNGSPIQRSRSLQVVTRDHDESGSAGGIAGMIAGAGHGVAILETSGGDSVPAGLSGPVAKKRKRVDSNNLFN